jgi:hypothetical protein
MGFDGPPGIEFAMIPGIVAASSLSPSAPSGPYHAPAVTFNAARLVLDSLSCVDNEFFSFAGWFKSSWPAQSVAWIVDPEDNYNSYLSAWVSPVQFNVGAYSTAFPDFFAKWTNCTASGTIDGGWHHFIGSANTNFPGGNRKIKFYIDGVDRTANYDDEGGTAQYPNTSNGLPLWVGTDLAGSNSHDYVGDMADVSIWPGVSFLDGDYDLDPDIVALFRDPLTGKPVDPTVAVAALGTPAVMLSGNAVTFRLNTLGASGPLTIAAGSLSDASSSPSD